jgi:pyruvate-formate lyase-activating enzyme
MHPDSYNEPFTYHDLARIAFISKRTHQLPLVLPTQHQVTPSAVEDLLQVGVAAVMIGAIVAGDTPEQWRRVSGEFRKKMDEVWR